jgi:hypothetical protein
MMPRSVAVSSAEVASSQINSFGDLQQTSDTKIQESKFKGHRLLHANQLRESLQRLLAAMALASLQV